MNSILSRVRTWIGRSTNGSSNGSKQTVDLQRLKPRVKLLDVGALSERNEVLDAMPIVAERADCIGPARCRKCDAELELVCPNGHGGADEVLADMVTPARAAAPPKLTEKSSMLHSIDGCNSPRVPWKGRGRKPTRCEKHLTKHAEAKSA